MTKKKTPPPVKKVVPNMQTESPKITINASDMYALEEQNAALRSLLSKHQSEQMPQIQNPPPQRATMISQFAEQMDGQLSRLYNSLNTLDGIANRLLIQKEDGVKGNVPEAHDLSSRYSNIVSYFSAQNDRLDFLNTKLSDLI